MTTATTTATLTVDGRPAPIGEARNLLEVIRRSGADLPTFCYHSELSVHGACRLCVVEVEGKGVQASCSLAPEPGMVVRTQTGQLRQLRRTTLELLLAAHDGDCTTCGKSDDCRLRDLSLRLGVNKVRFKPMKPKPAIDRSSPAVHHDAGKCILCGDCVRACQEIQGVGVLDFAFRGARTVVQPAFGKGLGEVDCVACGQCVRVCPTGALAPADDLEAVWQALGGARTAVVAQIAPAVRVAVGEAFGLPPGQETMGRVVAALRRIGFRGVYDTGFAADLTILEEAHEFARRVERGGPFPMFTSCCPAWVSWVERFRTQLIPHLSTCRSPQQMFGAVARRLLPEGLGCAPEDLVVVSIMPCTAKKAEAARKEFSADGRRDVDIVLTSQELVRLVRAAGIDPAALAPEACDEPFGTRSGAAILFGNTGGVAEAVLRYAAAELGDGTVRRREFAEVRGGPGRRIAAVDIGGRQVRLAVVSGLAEARRLLDDLRDGKEEVDLVEVMACPGGCAGGAGQPCDHDGRARARRQAAIEAIDRQEPIPHAGRNAALRELYRERLGGQPGSAEAHHLLHTSYTPHKRIDGVDLLLGTDEPRDRLLVTACLGTACHLRGGQGLVQAIAERVKAAGLEDRVDVRATFCLEHCGDGPNVKVGASLVSKATVDAVLMAIRQQLALRPA